MSMLECKGLWQFSLLRIHSFIQVNTKISHYLGEVTWTEVHLSIFVTNLFCVILRSNLFLNDFSIQQFNNSLSTKLIENKTNSILGRYLKFCAKYELFVSDFQLGQQESGSFLILLGLSYTPTDSWIIRKNLWSEEIFDWRNDRKLNRFYVSTHGSH